LTRDEMLQSVIKLYAGDGVEQDDIALVNRLRQQLPHSKISDLIFHDFRGLTPEQVLNEAVRREAEYAHKTTQE
jgi:hypothetical protein